MSQPVRGFEHPPISPRTPHAIPWVEWACAGTLWLHLFLTITTLAIGRSVGSALVLSELDGTGLAGVYVMVGVAIAGLAAVAQSLGRARESLGVTTLTLVIGFSLALLAGAFLPAHRADRPPFVGSVIYLIVESYAFATTIQYWSAVDTTLALHQARRSVVLLGTGGILGSIAGGLVTRLLDHRPPSDAFLVMAAMVLVQIATWSVFGHVSRRQRARHPKSRHHWNLDHAARSVSLSVPRSTENPNETAAGHGEPGPGVILRFGLVSLAMVFTTTLVDYYYKTLADRQLGGDVHKLTEFFGNFYLWVGLTTLVAQMGFTPWVLRRSAFAGLLASPMALALASVANLLVPGVAFATVLRLTDSALTHSTYRSCQELLYTPMPTRWVRKLKTISEGVFGRYGLLLAAGVACILEALGTSWLLVGIAASNVGWLAAVASLKREYRRQGAIASRFADESHPSTHPDPVPAEGPIPQPRGRRVA